MLSFLSNERPQVQFEVVKDPSSTGRRVNFKVKRTNFNSSQERRHISALDLAEKVVNSKEFRDKVIARNSFTSSNMNGRQVYDKMMTGVETLQKEKDYEFDIEVTMYVKNNSTVGYTYPNIIGFFVNNKFFKQYSLGEIAGNSVHEYLHKQGFGHTSNYTPERKDSVPYWIGYLVRDMVDDYVAGKITLTDLYPVEVITSPDGPVVIGPAPAPKPVPPVEHVLVEVCGWTKVWGFIPWYTCWKEKK